MNVLKICSLLGATGVAAAMALAPGQASAAVVVGPKLTSFNHATETRSQTSAIVHQVLPGYRATSPVDGVVTGWRVVGTGTFQLFTGRYTDGPGDVFQRNGYSEPRQGKSLTTPSVVFNASLPVKQGEHIGIALIAGASIAFERDLTGGDVDMWEPSLASVATPVRANRYRDLQNRIGFQAIIEPVGSDGKPPTEPTPVEQVPGDVPLETPPIDPGADPFPLPVPEDGFDLGDGFGGLSFDRPPHIKRAFKARRGALLTFDLSGPATATIEVRRKKRRVYKFVGQLSETVGASMTRVRIRRAVDGSRLTRGTYRLRVSAADDAGDSVASRWIKFKIRRP